MYQKENIFVLWEKSLQAVALFGTGGGLDWNIVKKMITDQFKDMSVDVTIFEPSNQFTLKNNKIPKMTASHLVLMKLKGGIPASQFNKLRLQKAAYFLNVSGSASE